MNENKKITWADALEQAIARSEIGETVEKLRPMVESAMNAVEIGNQNAIRRTRKRLHDAIRLVAAELLDRWNLPPERLDEVLSGISCK